MAKSNVTREELEHRREIVRSLMARGFSRPTKILNQKALKGYYDSYSQPRAVVKKDMDAVRKENVRVLNVFNGDEILGDYISEIDELISEQWHLIQLIIEEDEFNAMAYNAALKQLSELYIKKARAKGVDIEKLDAQQIIQMIGDVNLNNKVSGKVEVAIPDDTIKEFGDFLAKNKGCGLFSKESERTGS